MIDRKNHLIGSLSWNTCIFFFTEISITRVAAESEHTVDR